jgi:hypothetical protein
MTSAEPRRPPARSRFSLTRDTEERTAAGIYGIIISVAVMAATYEETAVRVITSVLVTLITYWTAERYAVLVAERIHDGHRPAWHQVRLQLTAGWEIVTASALPLAVLVILKLLGVGLDQAINVAMTCGVVLLCLTGWSMGRHGQLSALERIVSAAAAGLLGVVLILLKSLFH